MDHARLLESDCEILPIEHRGRPGLFIRNRTETSNGGISLPRELAIVLPLIDGRRTLDEITREVEGLSREIVEEIILALDGIYLIDNQRSRARRQATIQAFKQATVREPICAGGVYANDPAPLRRQIDSIYTQSGGPGLPRRFEPSRPAPRVVLSPHIDYRRGKHSFAWGFKEIAERSTATIYVIIATSHHSFSRFVLSAKDFRTPLGLVPTHRDFVNLIADAYGHECFHDEHAHQPEHSIELELPLLQHARSKRPDYAIVPLLVGSFSDTVDQRRSPAKFEEIQRMIEAIRSAEEACGEEVCYIVSGDLAHVGPKFGDRSKVTEKTSMACRQADERLLREAASGDADRLFAVMADDQDDRRICGFPPLYVALSAARPGRGTIGCYDQFVDPAGSEIVSFASMVFEKE